MSRFADQPLAGATFGPDDREDGSSFYRYHLWRTVGRAGGRRVAFVLLNPSTAGERADDPTLRRCIGFARTWGFDGLDIVNLFAWRSTSPDHLLLCAKDGCDVIGPRNDEFIARVCHGADLVVAGWGKARILEGRHKLPLRIARRAELVATAVDRPIHVIADPEAAIVEPRHPLYLKGTWTPRLWRDARAVAS